MITTVQTVELYDKAIEAVSELIENHGENLTFMLSSLRGNRKIAHIRLEECQALTEEQTEQMKRLSHL